MPDYNQGDLKKALKKLEISSGDSIFLTTGLGMLGVPETKNKNYMQIASKWILSSLRELIGLKGNIFVPTYSYSFSKKKKYFDPSSTKADIGYFPNFFLKQKNVVRSLDPMMSVAGIGPKSKKILLRISNNSFGKNCALERLLKVKNLKCCHIGLGYNWIPFIHYLDWKNKVPFRFDKIFYGYIKKKNKIKKVKWVYYVRHLRKETLSNGYKIGKIALQKKLYKNTKIGKSVIYAIDYKKFFDFSIKLTRKNKWLTVDGPKFKI
tara:strand:+ start:146 stop:937 length:792 start_codon:yes stop_codon:yes gene_type:complete